MASLLSLRVHQMLKNCLRLPSFVIAQLEACYSWLYNGWASSKRLDGSPKALTENTAKSRYRMGDETSTTIPLPDGRKIGYAQYGALSGPAVFYLHGTPGSRIEAAVFDEHAAELGARVIGVDRPSIDWSSPHPESTILDHAKDIEHLAKHLELHEYGVLVRSIYHL